MRSYLDFEKPVAELEAKIEELRALEAGGDAVAIGEEIGRIEVKAAQALKTLYAELTPWQKTQVARHPQRPHCIDYVAALIDDFMPLAGDRKFGEDAAIVGGFGRFRGESVCVIGHEKGDDTDSRAQTQFRHGAAGGLSQGSAADGDGRPFRNAGHRARRYRRRLSRHRRRGARTGRSHRPLHRSVPPHRVPNVAAIIGEGGSGGAIAVATANRVIMLEHSIYSVISPEGAASILWRDTAKAQEAAAKMKITAQDLVKFGVIDSVVPEPMGGAHRDPAAAIVAAGEAIASALAELHDLDAATVVRLRREKFMAIGRTFG